LPVCGGIVSVDNYTGQGTINDIPSGSSCMTNNENNSAWFKMKIDSPGLLIFDIVPVANDDYDFSLYNITNETCQGIKDGTILPERCSYSAFLGSTGLRPGYTLTSGGVADPPFLAPLNVNTGDVFVLVVDNFNNRGAGYALDFSGSTAVFSKEVYANRKRTITSHYCPQFNHIQFHFSPPIFNCSNLSSNNIRIAGTTLIEIFGVTCSSDSSIIIWYGGNFNNLAEYSLFFLSGPDTMKGNWGLCADSSNFIVGDSIYRFTINNSLNNGIINFDMTEDTTTEIRNDYIWSCNPDFLPNSTVKVGGSIGTVTGNRIVFFNTGYNQACLETFHNCSKYTICKSVYVYDNVGIRENYLNHLVSLYPNPAQNILTVELHEVSEAISLSITDLLGNMLIENKIIAVGEKQILLDCSGYSDGTYFIHLADTKGNRAFRKITVLR
jgi:hypothetical protein